MPNMPSAGVRHTRHGGPVRIWIGEQKLRLLHCAFDKYQAPVTGKTGSGEHSLADHVRKWVGDRVCVVINVPKIWGIGCNAGFRMGVGEVTYR
jgi:hypothetical protein